jgi:hypothetical protein
MLICSEVEYLEKIQYNRLKNQQKCALNSKTKLKLKSVALVREQTIPTKRPPLVGEVSAKFADRGVAWSAQRIPTVVNLGFLDRSHYFSFK